MVVGLEVHVQLKTRTKAFCRCSTSFGDPPNTNTCPVCLALPGALPGAQRARGGARDARGARARLEVHERSVFARKNYFYPDLPKGYQISQFDRPLAERGTLAIGGGRAIGITRIHMEEDAGKSVHDRFPGFTAIDLNRAGVPLIEIVSEPEIRGSAEAGAYLRALREILLYADVSDCSMEEGSLRVDANVSARPRRRDGAPHAHRDQEPQFVLERRARARARVRAPCAPCTTRAARSCSRRCCSTRTRTRCARARSKEGSHDYRYFPEPDLPPLVLARGVDRRACATALPEFPAARRARYRGDLRARRERRRGAHGEPRARRLLREGRRRARATRRRRPTG